VCARYPTAAYTRIGRGVQAREPPGGERKAEAKKKGLRGLGFTSRPVRALFLRCLYLPEGPRVTLKEETLGKRRVYRRVPVKRIPGCPEKDHLLLERSLIIKFGAIHVQLKSGKGTHLGHTPRKKKTHFGCKRGCNERLEPRAL